MKIRALTLALILAAPGLFAAISIQGLETRLTFDAYPSTNDWRGISIGTDNGSGIITTAAQLDAQVQVRSAASISNVLGTQTAGAPASFNWARWNASGGYIQSRIGNNWCALLLGVLRNDTPVPLRWLEVSYDVTAGPLPLSAEEVPGFRVYFSLSGEANSWVNLPALSGGLTGRVETVLDTIPAGFWAPGAEAYLLWADDNASGTDAFYTIDNLTLRLGPRLDIAPQAGGDVNLSWLEGWNFYWLEEAPRFGPTNWQTVPGSPANSGGRWHFNLSPTNSTFFRLRSPGI